MILSKWNPQYRRYDPYEVPDNWAVAVSAPTIDTFVDCAGCGKSIPYGAAFTSTEIHTEAGIGYAVCKKCYADGEKRANRKRYRREEQDAAVRESIERFDRTVGAIRAAHGLPPLGGATNGKT